MGILAINIREKTEEEKGDVQFLVIPWTEQLLNRNNHMTEKLEPAGTLPTSFKFLEFLEEHVTFPHYHFMLLVFDKLENFGQLK